ncbi:hypothetical protein Hamer_G003243 [Homarus americanus]|uniref:Uncharacterized protein n=1 Tax=Homarus americanus TaxID=6706 RepID=A0A8J5N6W5_HOMAM|nr:hypothetical protein Hamer_G003243 [Homarus americanus]
MKLLRAAASSHLRPVPVCLGKSDSMEVTWELGGRLASGDVRWCPHRDGSPEDTGRPVARREWKVFSITIDQAHEQNSALIQEVGVEVGLIDDPNDLCQWMVAGPDVVRTAEEFQDGHLHMGRCSDTRHHNQRASVQTAFAKDVRSLVNMIKELGNPFEEKCLDLIFFNTKKMADPAAVEAVRKDQHLLAKLSARDLKAQEAKYHLQCLLSLYNKARQVMVQASDEMEENSLINQCIALAELVFYIEDAHTNTEAVKVFKLPGLTRMYTTRLEQLGTSISGSVHSTDLKNRILTYFPDLQAHKEGRDVFLVFNEDVGPALRKACDHDADNDDVHLTRAASIVRSDMYKLETSFTGTFNSQCQGSSVPNSLMALVSMILYGSNVKTQSSYNWAQMLVAVPSLPSPSEWGWTRNEDGGWEVKWTGLPDASHACQELLRCGCKKGCRGQCKCVKAVLQCTALCLCGGLCDRE